MSRFSRDRDLPKQREEKPTTPIAPQAQPSPSVAGPATEEKVSNLEQEIITLKNQVAQYLSNPYVSNIPPADKEVGVWRSASGKWLWQTLPFGVDTPGNWKLFYSNGSGAVTELALGAADTVLTSSGASSAPSFAAVASGMSLKVKTADVSISSDATLNDDASLLFAVAANEKWQFEGLIVFASGSAPDFQFAFTGPAGSVGAYTAHIYADAGTALLAAEVADALGSAIPVLVASSANHMIRFWGAIANGGNAGNLTFQWAQNSSVASSTTVHAGSYIKYQVQE